MDSTEEGIIYTYHADKLYHQLHKSTCVYVNYFYQEYNIYISMVYITIHTYIMTLSLSDMV